MSRLLCIAALAACAAPSPEPTDGVENWVAHWETTRRCLAPDAEAVDDVASAIAVSRLAGTTRNCVALLHGLAVDVPPDAHEWRNAVLTAASLDPHAPVEALANTIVEVDRMAARLRIAVGMPRVERRLGARITPLPRGTVLSVFGHDLRATDTASFEYGIVRGRIEDGEHQIDFATSYGFAVRGYRHLRGVDVVVPGDDVAREPMPKFDHLDPSIVGVLEYHGRWIVVRTRPQRSLETIETNRTQRVAIVDLPADLRVVSVYLDPIFSILEVFGKDREGRRRVFTYHPGDQLWTQLLGEAHPEIHLTQQVACRAGKVTYSLWRQRVHGGSLDVEMPADARVVDCTPYNLMRLRNGSHLEICNGDRCADVFDSAVPGVAAFRDGSDTWIHAAELSGIVAVSTDKQPPLFFRLSMNARLAAILHIDVPYLVTLEPDGKYRFIALPNPPQ